MVSALHCNLEDVEQSELAFKGKFVVVHEKPFGRKEGLLTRHEPFRPMRFHRRSKHFCVGLYMKLIQVTTDCRIGGTYTMICIIQNFPHHSYIWSKLIQIHQIISQLKILQSPEFNSQGFLLSLSSYHTVALQLAHSLEKHPGHHKN